MSRRHNFQTLSWFYDLHQRDLLNLNPPYQRRSVWNQSFKAYFVDTVLLEYPAPAIFLFEEISEEGQSRYHVVDGKQRLTTLFEFVQGEFPVSARSDLTGHREMYFGSLPPDVKKSVWGYQFLVEYVPSDDEDVINSIFDRINRNVAKLSPQELRHARFDGVFISAVEGLAEWMLSRLPSGFPRIAAQSLRQMKDVEFVSLLALLLEVGPQGYSQSSLDDAFSERDDDWEQRSEVDAAFRDVVEYLRAVLSEREDLGRSRLRNQADFYSLVGAIGELASRGSLPSPKDCAKRLARFVERIEDDAVVVEDEGLKAYFEAARSASNDVGPRKRRIEYMKSVLQGVEGE